MPRIEMTEVDQRIARVCDPATANRIEVVYHNPSTMERWLVARVLATLHRSTLATRTKHELENLIQEHQLWGHLSRVNSVIVLRDEALHTSNWPFPKTSAALTPPSALDRADVATF